MILRDAQLDDAAAIAAIANHYIRDTTVTFTTVEKTVSGVTGDIAARQSGGQCFLVVERAERIAGFATCFAFRPGPGYARTLEHTVLLAPGEEGRGMGRALVIAIARRARAAKIESLIAGISAENADAIRFHTAMGFAEVGRIPRAGHKFDRWIDLVLMQKLLSAGAVNR